MQIPFGDAHSFPLLFAQQFDVDRGVEASATLLSMLRKAFMSRRFQATDLLLGRAHPFGQLLLRKTGFLSQGGQLQHDIPCITGFLETFGKFLILELLFELFVEICLSFHCLSRFHGSMLTDLKREVLRGAAHLQEAQEILQGRVPFRAEHATQALFVDL